MRKLLWGVAALACAGLLVAQATHEKIDLGVAHRIRTEAFGSRSRVMDTAFYLTDVYGPRLTGSPAFQAAGEWAVKKMTDWGLTGARLEPWGPFGRGWQCTHFAAEMQAPEFMPLIGYAQPWSPGTDGAQAGEAILAPIAVEDDLAKFRGKLKGKVVLAAVAHPSAMVTAPYLHRLTDDELAAAAVAPDPASGNPAALPLGFPSRSPSATAVRAGRRLMRPEIAKFLKEEGALVVLTPGAGPDGGTVMGGAAGSPNATEPPPPPSVVITNEHYNRIARLLEHNIPVRLAFDIRAQFTEPADSFNVVAEIPGTNPEAGLVMLGGHLDSWTGGTGATDNAAGTAIAMEAVRILKTLDLKMARTVRIGLWAAEEQGLLGSRAYVKQHFADPGGRNPKPEYGKLSAYFNLDNGAGKIRGVYMQDNDEMRPIFEAWLEPFRDLGAATLTIRNTGSTDHMAFDSVGLPGFQFIQDPLEYGLRTHHSNMDLYDRLQPGDLQQASAVMAWFVYNAASRPEMLPRKPAPAAARP